MSRSDEPRKGWRWLFELVWRLPGSYFRISFRR